MKTEFKERAELEERTELDERAELKGKFRIGIVQRTKGQRKKHVSQMTDKEIIHIHNRVKSVPSLYASGHVIDKIKHDGLRFHQDMVVEVMLNVKRDNIIEYNRSYRYGKEESRVLLRSDKSYPVKIKGLGEVDCNLCFVISLDTGSLVTVYWNHESDNHGTLNMKRYDANLAVL